ncbi:serine/threonine-protein kinase atr-like [Fopius arisanus]|uniref:Serine/threonine-protein kinase ATR n=1 Tax=Fopius arisanus TaxID=64838 RepID=A0A9R1T8P0_9HYME|nr:PREDICTED: serine/threonine-protein kinase atr-like [Fopius arisanus]
MEIDEPDSPDIQQRIAVAESLWAVICAPAMKIFSLKKTASEPTLRAFLELLNGAAENFINILIPPYKSGLRYDSLKLKYSAFTKWLFGVLFHVVGDPLNPQILLNSLEVQARMLRILSRLYLPEFLRITEEYLAITDELLEFESNPEKSQTTIKRFVIEPNAIEKLVLTNLPVTITRESIVTTEISIMKIIIKSGVTCWPLEDLWDRALRIITKCRVESKVISMELVSQLLQFTPLDDCRVKMFVFHCIEVVRTHSTLQKSPDDVYFNVMEETPVILKNLLSNLQNSSQVVDLCMAIVEATTSGRLSSKELEHFAIEKIRDHLIRHPRAPTQQDHSILLRYLSQSSKFPIVVAHFVIYQLDTFSGAGQLVAASASPLWRSIQLLIFEKIDSKSLEEVRKCLEVGRTISLWMMGKKIRGKLFDDSEYLMAALTSLLEASQDPENRELIFLCLMELMIIDEFPKSDVQKLLLLPWFPDKSSSNLDISRRLSASLKSLTMTTKLKCLERICEFGTGRVRIKFLSTCVSNCELELAVAAVRNSILLLNDPEVSFNYISLHILRPAVVAQKMGLQEAVVGVLGDTVCFVSGKAQLIRPEWDSLAWRITCDTCDKHFDHSPGLRDKLPIDESIFSSYFSFFSSSVLSVRRAMSKILSKLSNHVHSFSTNSVCQTWLALINDQDEEIRNNIANSIATLAQNKLKLISGGRETAQDDCPRDLEEFIELVIDKLAEGLTRAHETSNESLQMSIINTTRNLARAGIYCAEQRICIILIIFIMHPESSYTAVASAIVAFKEVASYCKLTPYKLFLRYRKDFVQSMTQLLANNFVERNYSVALSLIKIVQCIGYSGAREFMRKDGSLVVSYLIPMALQVTKVCDIFKEIADLLGIEEREMFLEYFQQICPHVFVNEAPEVGPECLELVSKLSGISLRDLMKMSFIGIFRKVLLHFHDKMEEVLICLEVISEFDPDHGGDFESNESIANYLKPHLHAVLVKFDTNLGPLSDERTQKSALGSLGALIKFMGAAHISPLRYKILTTLRTCLNLNRPGFKRLSCYAWDCFLRNVSLEDLGPLLPTICVSMVPLLDSYPQEANAMMEFLLIDNNVALQSHISEIFFIEDLRVHERISSVVSKQVIKSSPRDPEAGLKIWTRRIKHETDEVRFKALGHLKKFLELHRSHLNDMILSNTDVHPLVVDLLDSLLAGCQEKDESIRLRCGECLGELGAVEPSLLPRRIVSKDDSQFIPEMNETFALEVLQELVRALQMEKITQNVDCFSLAIQEILKTFEISPSGSNSRIWNFLSSTTQERILPLLNSRYKHTADPDPVESPVYGSSAGSTFEKWLYNWTCSMILKIKDQRLSSVLRACQPALRRDSRTTMFCIPHIFTHIITKGSDTDRDRLLTEIFAVIKSEDQALDQELLIRRPLRRETNDKQNDIRVSDEARRLRCSQVVFSTLDHVMRWLGEKRRDRGQNYHLMQRFVEQLDSLVLAEACYKSHEYHRALMYLERHMTSKNKGLSDQTESGLLAKIYTQLEEPDGVSGILATQDQSPTLQQLIVAHEVTGQLQDAAICYEKLAQRLVAPKFIQGMIHCYLGLDQPVTAMKFTEGVLSSSPELEPLIVEHEPFWRLANFVQLKDDKNTVKRDLLEDLRRGVQPDLQSIKKRLVTQLGATSHRVSYLQQSYPYIMKLHTLNEFEKSTDLMLRNIESLPVIFNEWEQREQLIKASRGVESVLGMRRAILDLFVHLIKSRDPSSDVSLLKQEIGKIWLKSAKIARKSGLYQQAYMYILSASDSCPPQELNIELAQLYWQKNCQEEARITLKRSFTNCFDSLEHYQQLPLDMCPPDRKNFAKAKLLFARYNEETLNVDNRTNEKYYEEAYCAWKSWGKSTLALAQYQESFAEGRQFVDNGTRLSRIITYYGRSLQYSCKYVHQAMPRMLTIWMDFAEKVHRMERPTKEQVIEVERMTKIIDVFCTRLPTYVWLTALSQLVSRISHPSKEVQEQLIKILVRLIAFHPQYCMWMMACVLNSKMSPGTSFLGADKRPQSFKDRIWHHRSLHDSTIKRIMMSFRSLWEKLIEFTSFKIEEGVSRTKVSILCRGLPKLLKNQGFGPIMMPTTQFFRLILPADGAVPEGHDPHSNDRVSIVGIEEEVTVMTSAQKPKKIMLRGSDGKRYSFMCKPDDDLRRDFRLMEFNGIVNKHLQKDPESRQRRLYIRTYSVVPLHEKCGIIEWVQNLLPFRQALLGIYRERNLGMSGDQLRKHIAPPQRTSLEDKRKVFLEKLIPRHPPVLGDWFRLMFPDPYAWYEARTAYIRTTAVMSMVGYVLGLGDRHGENILFDCKCGDAVHVDFNCLFNTGETLNVPEKVPFRLTHNMVSAMGPLRYEGPFRKSCEATMRVLRTEAKTLNSVLRPFVYTERVSDAEANVRNIEQRLAGFVKLVDESMVQLSVSGQVNHLILDATNVDNLCQMYYGWGAQM